MEIDKKFSRREWLLIIIVFCMAEYWLISSSFTFKNSQLVVNYVTFAAAISSIVLAIIAIMLSLMQSVNQSAINNQISSHVDSLEGLTSKLIEYSDNIGENAKIISGITDNISKLESSIELTHGTVKSVCGTIEKMAGNQEKFVAAFSYQNQPKTHHDQEIEIDKDNIIKIMFRRISVDSDAFCFFLKLYAESEKKHL